MLIVEFNFQRFILKINTYENLEYPQLITTNAFQLKSKCFIRKQSPKSSDES